jgi:hypothetical protein
MGRFACSNYHPDYGADDAPIMVRAALSQFREKP